MKTVKYLVYVTCFAVALLSKQALCEEKQFESLDLNKNNAISYDEFYYIISNLPSTKQAFANTPNWTEAIEILFKAFDKDKNKELSRD